MTEFTFPWLYKMLMAILLAGTGARVVYCLLRSAGDGDDGGQYRTRIINAIIFLIIATTILTFTKFMWSYFGSGSFTWFK